MQQQHVDLSQETFFNHRTYFCYVQYLIRSEIKLFILPFSTTLVLGEHVISSTFAGIFKKTPIMFIVVIQKVSNEVCQLKQYFLNKAHIQFHGQFVVLCLFYFVHHVITKLMALHVNITYMSVKNLTKKRNCQTIFITMFAIFLHVRLIIRIDNSPSSFFLLSFLWNALNTHRLNIYILLEN